MKWTTLLVALAIAVSVAATPEYGAHDGGTDPQEALTHLIDLGKNATANTVEAARDMVEGTLSIISPTDSAQTASGNEGDANPPIAKRSPHPGKTTKGKQKKGKTRTKRGATGKKAPHRLLKLKGATRRKSPAGTKRTKKERRTGKVKLTKKQQQGKKNPRAKKKAKTSRKPRQFTRKCRWKGTKWRCKRVEPCKPRWERCTLQGDKYKCKKWTPRCLRASK